MVTRRESSARPPSRPRDRGASPSGRGIGLPLLCKTKSVFDPRQPGRIFTKKTATCRAPNDCSEVDSQHASWLAYRDVPPRPSPRVRHSRPPRARAFRAVMSTVARPLAAGVRAAGLSARAPGASRAVALSAATPRSAKAARLASRSTASRALVVRAADAEDAPAEAPAPAETPAPAAPPSPADPELEKIAAATAEIKAYLKLLYVKREMNFNEVRLTLAIEDPRLADRRERYGIEDESGVSADEKVAQLELIDAGETPTDLLALEMLLEDFREWPGLEEDATSAARRAAGPSRYAEIANSAAGIRGTVPGQRPGGSGGADAFEEDESPEMDGNPFGFLVLYGVSAVPIFITIAALSIMFVNSLQ